MEIVNFFLKEILMQDKNELREQIEATSNKLNLNEYAVEKDIHITRAIHTLSQVQNDYFALVFQGGTSLSKAYKVIKRLSEDADFRVIQKPIAEKLGKGARRNKLRRFRHALIETLRQSKFNIPEANIKVFYEGRFTSIQAEFEGANTKDYLKPFIAIECFAGKLALPPKTKQITTLIKETLGEHCDHETRAVSCVSLDETAAEKWVALTRRVANSRVHFRESHKHLVRHLYDLYHLSKNDLLTGAYTGLVKSLIEKDRLQFRKYNSDYLNHPVQTSEAAFKALNTDPQWRDHWQHFLDNMVYDAVKPTFDDAYSHLQTMSQTIFEALSHKAEATLH
jgi:predicted nucleotidyltransferase component of viral defense system